MPFRIAPFLRPRPLALAAPFLHSGDMAVITGTVEPVRAGAAEPEQLPLSGAATEGPPVSLGRLMLSILWVGAISMGGRSASFLLDELVLKRKWLRREDWLEANIKARAAFHATYP